jgi:hypothetical protein
MAYKKTIFERRKEEQEVKKRLDALMSELDFKDRTEERRNGLILCEECQKFFPRSEMSEEAGDGEGFWDDGNWGPIAVCIPCDERLQAEFEAEDF